MKPVPETDPTHIADEFNLPVPIRRSALAEYKIGYTGSPQLVYMGWGWQLHCSGTRTAGKNCSGRSKRMADLPS
jgi:hypothetical protein